MLHAWKGRDMHMVEGTYHGCVMHVRYHVACWHGSYLGVVTITEALAPLISSDSVRLHHLS
jgi:hypothetical protein